MKTIVKIITLLLLTIAMIGCPIYNCIVDDYTPIVVYRMNNDYSQNVRVNISQGKVSSGVSWNSSMVTLIDGYYAERSMPPNMNVAYLSLTISEIMERRNNGEREFTREELEQFIIDRDPFIDYYSEKRDSYGQFVFKNHGIAIDTAKLNDIIRRGELETYFYKLK